MPELAKQQLGVDYGLAVEDVTADSPAAKAEIKPHDILVKAGDVPLKEAGDLVKVVEGSEGKDIKITIVRGGKDRTITVTPARRPGVIAFGLTPTWTLISAEVLANPAVGTGVPVQALRVFTLVPAFAWLLHPNVGPVVPLLSEHAWISAPATRSIPRTTRVHGRTAHGPPRLPLRGNSLAFMILAP